MEVLFLLGSTAVMMIFGYCIMRKLGSFLEENQKNLLIEMSQKKKVLRIAFSEPWITEALLEPLDAFSEIHSDVEFSFYGGNDKTVLKSLSDGRTDIAILSTGPELSGFNEICFYMKHNSCQYHSGNAGVLPIEEKAQRALWKKGREKSTAGELAKFLSFYAKRF